MCFAFLLASYEAKLRSSGRHRWRGPDFYPVHVVGLELVGLEMTSGLRLAKERESSNEGIKLSFLLFAPQGPTKVPRRQIMR